MAPDTPSDVVAATITYTRRKWSTIPIQHRGKSPEETVGKGWQDLRLTEAEIPQWFNGSPMNVGILMGEPSDHLIDIDLDCPEVLALADEFLPSTPAVFGRASAPRSHRLFRCPDISKTTQFTDPAGGMLVEIRSTGGQTVFPPSVHESGEAIAWVEEGEPPLVDAGDLRQRVEYLAAASLLVRHWPKKGSRQDAALAFAGVLLRRGWNLETTAHFIWLVASTAGDDEVEKRVDAVSHTKARIDAGEPATGLPKLRQLFDGRVVDRVVRWMHLAKEGLEAASINSEVGGFPLTFEPVGRNGRVRATITLADGSQFVDKFDATSAKCRDHFLKRLLKRHPELPRDELEAGLERMGVEIGSTPRTGADGSDGQDPASERRSLRDELIDLATEGGIAELFHTPGRHEGEPFATIKTAEGHRETWPVMSRGFRWWLVGEFRKRAGSSPPTQAVQEAIEAIAGIAMYDGPDHAIAVRIAGHEGAVWLDLCDAQGRAVRITPEGWQVIEGAEVPVRFVRRRGMLPLPVATRGGSIEELRPLLNLPKDDDWILTVAFLVGCFRPFGPYPILAANGEQGTGKSYLVRTIRALVDPAKPQLRRPPREERDLMIAATNCWVVAYDNLSGIHPWLSDSLCSLATGGGFATRELYTDAEEKLFDAARPIIVNGIEDVATRSDFLDRSIILRLPVIAEEARREEADLLANFEAVRPRILGALLDAVSCALRRRSSVKLARKPRMADFATWVAAAEPGLGWEEGTFLAAYMGNREEAHDLALEASPIGAAVLAIMQDQDQWEGTATQLLAALDGGASDARSREHKDWPRSPRAMRGALDRVAPNLRAVGLEVTCGGRDKSRKRSRMIVLDWQGRRPSIPSEPSGTIAAEPQRPVVVGRSSDGLPEDPRSDRPTNTANQRVRIEGADGTDGLDGVDRGTVARIVEEFGRQLAERAKGGRHA